jgi:ribose transport system substrate-binding protein
MKIQYAALMSVVLAAAVGCGSSDKTANAGGEQGNGKLKIAVIPKGTTHEFWKSIHAGAKDAADELGAEIIWKGPLKEDEKEGQVRVVEDFIVEKVSGIVLAPLDDTALRIPVADAKAKGIPVVIIDSGLKSEDYVSFVATDNEKGGQLAAQKLIELLGGKGKVVMMRYQAGSASTDLREKGFLEGIKAAKGIVVVSENQEGGATTESAQRAAENILNPLKSANGGLAIDGIFCPNESTTFGMLRYLQDAKYAGKVKFVGFDASEKLVEALRAGEIDGLVLQNPYKMGYLGVKTMIESLQGKTVEKRVDTGVAIVTKANMDTKESKELLTPKQID